MEMRLMRTVMSSAGDDPPTLRRHASWRVAIAALVALAASGAARSQPAPSLRACPYETALGSVWTCPDKNHMVTVDRDYDTSPSSQGWLDADEIQCAIDCLDGDPDQEHSPTFINPLTGRGIAPAPIAGGVLEFVTGLDYRVAGNRNLRLPMFTDGPLLIRGHGAMILAEEATVPSARAILSRVVPSTANSCDADLLQAGAARWTIEGLTLGTQYALGTNLGTRTGIEIHALSMPVIRNCVLQGLGVGIALHRTPRAVVRSCRFRDCVRHDVLMSDGTECVGTASGQAGPCWGECANDLASALELADPANPPAGGLMLADNLDHVADNYHETRGGQPATVRVNKVAALIVDGEDFAGERPDIVIDRSGVPGGGSLALRNSSFWPIGYSQPGVAPASPLISNRAGGLAVIEMPWFAAPGGQPEFLYEASGKHASRTVFRNLPSVRNGDVMRARPVDGLRARFVFENYDELQGWSPTTARSWIDDLGGTTAPPPDLAVRSFGQFVLGPSDDAPAWMHAGTLWRLAGDDATYYVGVGNSAQPPPNRLVFEATCP